MQRFFVKNQGVKFLSVFTVLFFFIFASLLPFHRLPDLFGIELKGNDTLKTVFQGVVVGSNKTDSSKLVATAQMSGVVIGETVPKNKRPFPLAVAIALGATVVGAVTYFLVSGGGNNRVAGTPPDTTRTPPDSTR